MQPKTERKLNEKDFNILKRTIKNISVSRRGRIYNSSFATELPESIGIKLTNKCNLRCRHCYQWNDSGYHQFMEKSEQSQDIDFDLIKKVLLETDEYKSRLYLWGGEPLVYPDFDKVASLLEKNPRETAICTNATLLSDHIDSILKISSDFYCK
jgi:MoaA/NifB/PqqE/SkfB family radical SAM enzyme